MRICLAQLFTKIWALAAINEVHLCYPGTFARQNDVSFVDVWVTEISWGTISVGSIFSHTQSTVFHHNCSSRFLMESKEVVPLLERLSEEH